MLSLARKVCLMRDNMQYYTKRAKQERDAAMMAHSPIAAFAHQEMAGNFEKLVLELTLVNDVIRNQTILNE
ncbi:MAG: hypothetical protein JWO15_2350 [Sphingomonadales bacterium]|nr:hypothetical protein [Sphingomonadales bacterium]